MIIRHRTILRFTLVEVALALAIVGVGISAVLLLTAIGAKAGRDGRAESGLEEVSEQMTAFLQARFSAPAKWKDDGGSADDIPDFDPAPADIAVPVGRDGFSEVAAGLLAKGACTYICIADGFEAMVRVGLDNALLADSDGNSFWNNRFYRSVVDGTVKKLTAYPNGNTTIPQYTRINGTPHARMFGKFYRPLIVELSWPIDVVWSKREKRFLRLELFNENFIPYPPNP